MSALTRQGRATRPIKQHSSEGHDTSSSLAQYPAKWRHITEEQAKLRHLTTADATSTRHCTEEQAQPRNARHPLTLRLDENRERPVVDQRDLHHRAELASFDVQAPAS